VRSPSVVAHRLFEGPRMGQIEEPAHASPVFAQDILSEHKQDTRARKQPLLVSASEYQPVPLRPIVFARSFGWMPLTWSYCVRLSILRLPPPPR
jgi:hypothetical protein